jgi:hypothetical protein
MERKKRKIFNEKLHSIEKSFNKKSMSKSPTNASKLKKKETNIVKLLRNKKIRNFNGNNFSLK